MRQLLSQGWLHSHRGLTDLAVKAIKLVKAINEGGGQWTTAHCADVFYGSKAKRFATPVTTSSRCTGWIRYGYSDEALRLLQHPKGWGLPT